MKRLLAAALIAISLAAAGFAQPETNLVGTWKMDASRSSFKGNRDAPVSVVISFEREDKLLRETIKVVNSRGENMRTITYALDGGETLNGSGDERVKAKLLRDAGNIVLEWIDDGGTFMRTLKLSTDGRTLSIKTRDSNPDGQSDDLIVLQRQ